MSVSESSAPPHLDEPSRGRFTSLRSRRAGARPAGPLAPLSPTRAAIITTFGTLTVLAAWFVLYALFFSGLQESHAQHVMYSHLRQNLAQATVPFGGVIAPGTPVAFLSAPEIELHAVVVEGTSSKELAKGPGHYPSSPFPGQAGIAQIYGRSATFGSPFDSIGSLKSGESIAVTTGQGTFTYHVIDVRRAGDQIPSALATDPSTLTLVTSAGSGWRSGWAPTQVIYVDTALATGKLQPAPAGRPATSAPVDAALAPDTGDLIPLVLWLQAAVLLAAGLVYSHARWTPWQLWLVGLPTAVAVLWGVTSTALLLLPNLA